MRHYHTGIGRFMARDMLARAVDEGKVTPAELTARGVKLPLHLYTYADNDPVSKTDSMGFTPWTDRRTTISVQELVDAKQDNIYGPETCEKVKKYQSELLRRGYLGQKTNSGKDSRDGKWGNQTEDAYLLYVKCKDMKKIMLSTMASAITSQGAIKNMLPVWEDVSWNFVFSKFLNRAGNFFLGGSFELPDLNAITEEIKERAMEKFKNRAFMGEILVPAIELKLLPYEMLANWSHAKITAIEGIGLSVVHAAAAYAGNKLLEAKYEALVELAIAIAKEQANQDIQMDFYDAARRVLHEKCPASEREVVFPKF